MHIDNMNRILPRGEVLPVPLLSCITFGPPMWLDLRRLVNLDALGDPAPGPRGEVLQEVEIRMEDGEVLRAGWTLPFCDRVVATLERRGVERR